MKVLVIGSGAREHALVRALGNDELVTQVVCAPGNPGIAQDVECLALDVGDVAACVAVAQQTAADLVVVGPEAPLVAGVGDALAAQGIDCVGPSAAAARLEGSKQFAKDVMLAAGVPTAASLWCVSETELVEALDRFGAPYVVKADGLAGGKGVVVTDDRDAALAHGQQCLAKASAVLVEEFLDGPEFSVFCVTDGTTVRVLGAAQDYKRVGDGGEGPNTGGMGAYSPVPWVTPEMLTQVEQQVAQPVVDWLRESGTPYVGVLYCGLANTSNGIRVVEFNVRFGDPDGNVVLARLTSPLGELLSRCVEGTLAEAPPVSCVPEAAVTVVLAAAGYPAAPRTGDVVAGELSDRDGSYVLYAGVQRDGENLVSGGGRVLSTVALAGEFAAARTVAYAHLRDISLLGGHFRTDIAAGL